MNGLIRASLRNPIAVTVMTLSLALLGALAAYSIPVDILPVFNSPAVQVLTFYGGMPAASIEKNITARMERGVVQASGGERVESRSIVGASIVRDYFGGHVDRSGALTECASLAGWEYPTMPPGTLPPVILPYDPTSSTPVCLVALDSQAGGPDGKGWGEGALFDTGRYEVRPMVMSRKGALAPLVYGGKVRAVMVYLDRQKLQARHLAPLDVLKAVDDSNVFLPTGSAKFGDTDYAIDSNSMFDLIGGMGDIPLRNEHGNAAYLRDVGTPKDANYIQTNVVRVNGRRQVYIPVFRQLGASTLQVVHTLKGSLESMTARLTRTGIDLKLVMDQSIYVRHSIESLVEEGVLGALLCSLVILIFLGQWRMTAIAVMTIPISVLTAVAGLYAVGQTINVMTLAGLALAVGPLVDSAIICLENTHRHLGMGATPEEAAYRGASEVALPELVSTLCTFLVLAPLAFMPGLGSFLFRPMAMAVAFAMTAAYFLSRTFVPSRSARWLLPHAPAGEKGNGHEHGTGLFARWEALIDRGIAAYSRALDVVLQNRVLTVSLALGLMILTLVSVGPRLRREFFPEVDAGAFEVYARAPSGTRIEVTEQKIEQVEAAIRETLGDDLQLVISELGVVADLSAAYTPNAGPMDAVVKVQLTHDRARTAQEWVQTLRQKFASERRYADLEFAFDAGGMIRAAMNQGKSSPINVRVTAKDPVKARAVAEAARKQIARVDGVVDARIIQRLDYPQYVIEVDRHKAADLGLTQAEVMKNVVAALNSSIQFHKKNFWIDPVSKNQYFVGVQYFEEDIHSVQTLLDVPVTSPRQAEPIPLRNIATLRRGTVPTEITRSNLQSTMDLTLGVQGRDLGHVAADVGRVLDGFGAAQGDGTWIPYDPAGSGSRPEPMKGASVELTGEYARMQDTFRSLGFGLAVASVLMYFLMAALDKSYVVPLTVMLTVPLCLVGVLPTLFYTGTALNVQSLLGIIFIVGIKVANTVLMTDYAQELRRHAGLSPTEAIRRAAAVRVRPVTMTALAAFFAMVPMALAWGRGSEATAPLGRAILGGLLAGEPATLFVLPALYSLMVRDRPGQAPHTPGTDEEVL
ncbi:MAG: efflux RND transporter permease subunit [Isosphaeraceae bacterium]